MYYYVTFLTSTVAANHLSILFFRLVCSSGWFVLPVGLCFRLVCASGWFVRMENNKCTPNTNNYFKNT